MTLGLIIPIKMCYSLLLFQVTNYSPNFRFYAVLHFMFQPFNSHYSLEGCMSFSSSQRQPVCIKSHQNTKNVYSTVRRPHSILRTSQIYIKTCKMLYASVLNS